MKDLIPDLKFRHIRFVNQDGRFIKARRKFRYYHELLEFLKKKKAADSYYSTAKWLNPERITQEKKEGDYDTVFLGCDLFFDVDSNEKNIFKVVEETREGVKRVLDFIRWKGWEIRYIAFSGAKGFHVSVKDPLAYSSPEPKKRETEAKEFRAKIAREVTKKGLNVDLGVLKDVRRIVRIPFTYNSRSGYMCYPIQEKDLDLEPKEFLGRIPKIGYGGTSPLKRAMKALRLIRKSLACGFPSTPQAEYYIGFSVSSTIAGTKRHTLMLEFDNKIDITGIIDYLGDREIIPLYTYRDYISTLVFSPTALDRGMILKTMKRFNARNYNAFKKYSHSLMRVGRFYTPSFREVAWEVECREIIGKTSDRYPCSRAHCLLLDRDDRTNVCGSEEVIVRLAKITP
ncbi:MAG: hypothetical protein JW778_03060 [Candidatus Altiarchaeota archaeon]|nr:hypothetical protein [Candidatus Altiarchaeota archaeon]